MESSWRPWRTCWDLYAEPYDPQRPVVCFDETSTQLLADVREPLPAKPGRPRREDYEYQRGGTRNLFLTCEPRRGWRHVAITRQRTMQDFAQQMRWLVDEAYPDVPVIRLVLDNLNTHRMASLYETFPAAEARRIAKRLEFQHTPKHGSWLNMAEIEFSVLARACLRGRNGDEDSLERAVSACVSERNAIGATINHLAVHCPRRQTQTPSPLSLPILIWFSTSLDFPEYNRSSEPLQFPASFLGARHLYALLDRVPRPVVPWWPDMLDLNPACRFAMLTMPCPGFWQCLGARSVSCIEKILEENYDSVCRPRAIAGTETDRV